MSKPPPPTEHKTLALAWLMEHVQPGTKIFTHVTPHVETHHVDVYVILPDAQGELQSYWLNRYMKHLGIVKVNLQERILLGGDVGGIAQEMAELLGNAVYDDRSAFLFQQL